MQKDNFDKIIITRMKNKNLVVDMDNGLIFSKKKGLNGDALNPIGRKNKYGHCLFSFLHNNRCYKKRLRKPHGLPWGVSRKDLFGDDPNKSFLSHQVIIER